MADWDNLATWFVPQVGRPSRVQVLERDAVDAVRTLTQNLTRLSRTAPSSRPSPCRSGVKVRVPKTR